jgi:hypothetical protein
VCVGVVGVVVVVVLGASAMLFLRAVLPLTGPVVSLKMT